MSKKIKSILSVVLILLISNLAFSQSIKEQNQKRVAELKTALNLTTDQENQIKIIFKDSKEVRVDLKSKFKDSKGKGKEAREAAKSQLMFFRTEIREKIKQILNPEQKTKFEQMIQEKQQMIQQKKDEKIQAKKSQVENAVTN